MDYEQKKYAWNLISKSWTDASVENHAKINSWEYIALLRENILKNKNNAECLENEWELLNDHYGNIFDRTNYNANSQFETPIEYFVYQIKSGFYPQPEILEMIAFCFSRYLFMEGEEDLETIFFGNKKKRIGNYSINKKNYRDIEYLDMLLRKNTSEYNLSRKLEPLTKIEAAELTVNNLKLHIEPESLLKKYNRWVKDNKTNE